jgi:hypothetical protein
MLLARLFNAGINRRVLKETFKVDVKTMRRWGAALRSDDPERLIRALAGRGGCRKLTVEIRSFVRMRFPSVYQQNRKAYSRQIRAEIQEVFGESISGETLRPLFNELKALHGGSNATVGLPASTTVVSEDDSRQGELRAGVRDQAVHESEGHASAYEAVDPGADQDDDAPGMQAEASACDSGPPAPIKHPSAVTGFSGSEADFPSTSDRKRSPQLSPAFGSLHHLGVLVFWDVLKQIEQRFGESGQTIKQWLVATWLGAVNIEQSKLLDFEALTWMLGPLDRGLRTQRRTLTTLATEKNVCQLLAYNAELVGVREQGDFYYDPHTKHYTGLKEILKGWCSNIRWAGKVLHMDFFHTVSGAPVYQEHVDNYEDLRVRMPKQLSRFRETVGFPASQLLTLIIDRGVYSQEVFAAVMADPSLHLITWEKNYRPAPWAAEEGKRGSFVITRFRNDSTDLKTYRFEYLDQSWPKQAGMRRLRVRATSPGGSQIEVGILTDDLERAAEQIISLIFKRWVQENGFKYLDRHFGMKQITSYADQAYEEIRATLEDKQVKSGAYKALEKRRRETQKALSALLFKERKRSSRLKQYGEEKARLEARLAAEISSLDADTEQKLQKERRTLANRIAGLKRGDYGQRIAEQEEQLKQIEADMETTEKEISRLDFLVDEGYVRLDTRNKRFMDAIKILAHNAFYQALMPFKEAYDNYRDDHVYFRNLTHADGWFVEYPDRVEVVLTPTAHHSPKLRRILEKYLDQIQERACLPNRSAKPMVLRLAADQEPPPWAVLSAP